MAILYSKAYIVVYPEGDSSLERVLNSPKVIPQGDYQYYTVKDNDTLYAIAWEKFQDVLRWFEIGELNNIINPFELSSGTILILPKS